MTTAGIDPNLAHNLQLLQKQSLQVEFHLNHTDYKKVENIGTGAYGVVCSAINRKTRQKVAIKKIPNIYTMDPRYAIRTYREIKILQHFKHGNIIAIREILQPSYKDMTDIYVVMDLMESDLHRIIYSKQSLTSEHVMYFLYQILRGLKYIHSANVLHRDLKPSNLLVNADCELKIGDFGMARGINFKAEKSNITMTQYVATRWYRAPELIVAGKQGYGPAIDMWSVGCIFAEMLRRKHLFPGRDLLHQLSLIYGTLGIPEGNYMESLGSDTVCAFIRKVKESNDFKPRTCEQICPKASHTAVDLLSKMLLIEPEKRIDVEAALSHPFLSKYHDLSFEPRCNKLFDFAFEQDLVNLNTDDEKRVKIQELLRKEVSSYTKPKPMDFGALISSKSQETSQTSSTTNKDGDPYADLNAFLAQLASPDEKLKKSPNSNPLLSVKTTEASNSLLNPQPVNLLLAGQNQGNSLLANQSKNLLLEGSKPANPLLAGKSTNSLLATQSTNPLLAGPPNNPLLATQSTNPLLVSTQANKLDSTNSLLGQQPKLPFQNTSNSNPLLFGVASKTVEAGIKPEVTDNKTTTITLSTSESDQSNDTDLFNSFLKNRVSTDKQSDESSEQLTVNTLEKPTTDDIEMISAKLEQTDITSDKTAANKEDKPMDAKELIRKRLMEKKNSNASGNLKGAGEKPSGKSPITAFQRQKEREEKRKAKQQKAKAKRKSKDTADKQGALLTSEDQKMLDRWKAMAKPQPIQPKPTSQSTTASNNVIVVYPATAATGNHTYITTTIPVTSTDSNTTASTTQQLAHLALSNKQQANQKPATALQSTNPMMEAKPGIGVPSHFHINQPATSVQQPVGHCTPAQPNIRGGTSQYPAPSDIQSQPIGLPIHHTHNAPYNMHPVSSHQISSQPHHQLPAVPQMSNMSNVNVPMPHPSVSQMQPVPNMSTYSHHDASSRHSHQVRSFSDIAAMHGNGDQYYDNGFETSMYDTGPGEPDLPAYPSTSTGYPNYPPRQPNLHTEQAATNFPHWASSVSMNTTLDINTLNVPKQDEGLPPMLVSTPKGTGGGYGVGYDMESMMAYNPDLQNVIMDSAPLSASLLADWMDVTSNMDPKVLEDIQHELELSSALHEFPFN